MRRAYLRLSGAIPKRPLYYQGERARRCGHALAERAPYGASGLLLNHGRYREFPNFLAADSENLKSIRWETLTGALGGFVSLFYYS